MMELEWIPKGRRKIPLCVFAADAINGNALIRGMNKDAPPRKDASGTIDTQEILIEANIICRKNLLLHL
jgi:hypothetical protein